MNDGDNVMIVTVVSLVIIMIMMMAVVMIMMMIIEMAKMTGMIMMTNSNNISLALIELLGVLRSSHVMK